MEPWWRINFGTWQWTRSSFVFPRGDTKTSSEIFLLQINQTTGFVLFSMTRYLKKERAEFHLVHLEHQRLCTILWMWPWIPKEMYGSHQLALTASSYGAELTNPQESLVWEHRNKSLFGLSLTREPTPNCLEDPRDAIRPQTWVAWTPVTTWEFKTQRRNTS